MSGKKHLYTEREKVRHTTHWDMDYLPIEEVESYAADFKAGGSKIVPQKKKGRQQRRLGLVLIFTGVVLFAGAVLLGRFMAG